MKGTIFQATIAGLFILGAVGLSQPAQAQCATGFCGARTTLIQRPSVIERVTEAPIVSEPIIERHMVVERSFEQPMVVEHTCQQPLVVERTVEAPVVLDNSCGTGLWNSGMFQVLF
jgi:hypothetical protein